MHLYRSPRLNDCDDHHNYNCKLTFPDGSERLIYANWLHNQGLDQWKGWTCMAGAHRLYIDKDLAVWSGECRNDYLGTIAEGWDLLISTQCQQPSCSGCTDDLMVTKYR